MMHAMEERLARFEGAYAQITDRLNGIDRRLGTMDLRFDRLDAKVEDVEQRLGVRLDELRRVVHDETRDLRRMVDNRMLWLVGLQVSSWITIMGAIVFHR